MLNISGWLLAGLLLLTGAPAFSTLTSAPHPTYKAQAIQGPRTRPDGSNYEGRIADATWTLAGVTAVLALITGGLALFTFRLWGSTKDLVGTTDNSVRAVERAYVQMSHTHPGLHWNRLPESTSLASNTVSFTVDICNFGNTPANVSRVCLRTLLLESGQPLPTEPPYDGAKADFCMHAFLVKGKSFSYRFPFQTFTEEERERISKGEKTLYVIGFVDYGDKFGTQHRAGYARYSHRGAPRGAENLLFVTEDGYNYDRESSAREM